MCNSNLKSGIARAPLVARNNLSAHKCALFFVLKESCVTVGWSTLFIAANHASLFATALEKT